MRLPREAYQMQDTIAACLPSLSPAQRRGLTLWVYGAVRAKSACQAAVLAALLPIGAAAALRQVLRHWLYDGADKIIPGRAQVDVAACFAPLLRWVLSWWQSRDLALAIDATSLGDRVVVLAVRVLYRGCAIPVAWHVLPANQAGAWMTPIVALLRRLAPAVPQDVTVVVLSDRGLWSPRLWKAIRALGWHPLLRLQRHATFQPVGGRRGRADALVPGPGHAWIGYGTAFKHRTVRRQGPLLVVWDATAAEPWVLLTDVPTDRVGVCWYGLRAWIELGFRALKGVGWHWARTRRTDPARVARHWLVLAVATLWVLAYGTRAEDAARHGIAPAKLRTPVPPPPADHVRDLSVFAVGLSWLDWQLGRMGRLWTRVWLAPEPWPTAPPGLLVHHAEQPP